MAENQDTTNIKYCNGCKQTLPHSAFSMRSNTASGLATRCKPCASVQSRKWRYSPAGRAYRNSRRKGRPPVEQPTDSTRKRCTACLLELPMSSFRPQKAGRFGVASWCKQCTAVKAKERRLRPGVKERELERQRLWQRANPDKVKQYSRKYRMNNWQRAKAAMYAWRKKNPEKAKAVHKRRYYKDAEATRARDRARRARKWIDNPEQIKMWLRIQNHRRKARKLNAQGECSKIQFLAKCDFWGWRCLYCKVELTLKTVTLEHRAPLVKGGSNWPANIAPACPACNSMKGEKTEAEYRQIVEGLKATGWQPKYPDKSKRRGRKPRAIW